MKKQLVSWAIVYFVALFANNNVVHAQSGTNQNNGTLQIIKVCAPDSVIFTVAPGKEIELVEVHLLGKGQEITGQTRVSGSMFMKSVNGKLVFTYNDGSRFTTSGFNVPAGFKAEQVKFKTDGKEMFYNIAQSKWEKK